MSGLGEAVTNNEVVSTEVVEVNTDINDAPVVNEAEAKAREMGWKPKEEYEGDADDWRPAKQFLQWGDVISEQRNLKKQIQGMKKSYNEEIKGLNLLHKVQLETREKEIKGKLAKAVSDGDNDAASDLMKQHGDLQVQKNEMNASTPAKMDADLIKSKWEIANPWIFDTTDPKAKLAITAYNMALRQGMEIEEALEFVDNTVTEKFPNKRTNANPNRFSDPETLPSKSGGKSSQKLSMSQVTSDEKKLRSFFPSDEKFLEAVTNSRKGV